MAIELLTERHGDQIAGLLGCWDRMLIFGTLPKICFAGGMTSSLFERNIRIFDYPRFAAVPEPHSRKRREASSGHWHRDRVHPQTELPQRGSRETGARQTRRASGANLHLFRHGTLFHL